MWVFLLKFSLKNEIILTLTIVCLDLAKNVYPGDHALICVVSDFIEQSRRISGGFQSKSNIHGSYSYQCQLYLHNTVINHSLTYF